MKSEDQKALLKVKTAVQIIPVHSKYHLFYFLFIDYTESPPIIYLEGNALKKKRTFLLFNSRYIFILPFEQRIQGSVHAPPHCGFLEDSWNWDYPYYKTERFIHSQKGSDQTAPLDRSGGGLRTLAHCLSWWAMSWGHWSLWPACPNRCKRHAAQGRTKTQIGKDHPE